MVRISLSNCNIRTFREADTESLARHANNRSIWRNLRDLFPSPYSIKDARKFIARVRQSEKETHFAIEVDSQAAGSIGVRLREDVECRTAELGYWLGEPFWGRGLMTTVVHSFAEFAFREYSLLRIEAGVYEWNPASARVLEKCGFTLEGILRQSAVKDGQVIDRSLYALLADEVSRRSIGNKLS